MGVEMKASRDFTLDKYRVLCESILSNGYTAYTVYNYLSKKPESNSVIMRHDIDRKPENALKMAELEYDLGMKSTYYFRFVKGVFNPEMIRRIRDLGHEIGYHYEVLSKARGDYERAVELFEYELGEFRKICDVETICMHGSPLSRYDNRDLWNVYDFKDFGIIGAAYLSIGKDVNYFSDTGRSWNWKNKMRDFMPDKKEEIVVDTTDDLIGLVRENGADKLYILVHPERWAVNGGEWCFNYMKDFAFNVGKKVLGVVRG